MKIRTFKELLQQYIKEKPLSEATIGSYSRILNCFIKDTGITDLDQVSLTTLLEWRLTVIERSSDITWNTYLRHMRALWRFAIARNFVRLPDHFRDLNWGKYKSKKIKTISTTQLNVIIDSLGIEGCALKPSWFWKIVVKFIFYTGVRRRQLVTLRWTDVNLDKGIVYLSAEGEKTDKDRSLPLNDIVVSDLKQLKLMYSTLGSDSCHLSHQLFNVTTFYHRYKGPEMSEEQVSGFFKRLSKHVGFQISPHMLRHTMATKIARTGQIKTLQAILGHSNIYTTMNFYVHPDFDELRTLINGLERI